MSFVREVSANRLNAVKTVFGCLCMISWAVSITMLGPAILIFKELFHTTLEQLTMILPARAAGHVTGTIAAGYLLMSVEHQLVISISMWIMAISFAFINWVHTLYGFVLTMFVNGLCSGFAINGLNVWMLHMWGTHSPPFLHTISFGFSVGALMGPLLVAPFLEQPVHHSALSDHNLTGNSLLSTPTEQEQSQPHPLRIAIYISSLLTLLTAVLFTAMYAWKPANPAHPSRLPEKPIDSMSMDKSGNMVTNTITIIAGPTYKHSGDLQVQRQRTQDWKRYRLVLIIFGCLYIHLAHGLEVAVAGLLPVFVVKCSLGLSTSTASMMLSLYWVCFTISRALAIGVSVWMRPKYMIALDLTLVTLGNVLLLPLANDHEWVLWVGTALLGFGIATMWPSLWGFLEELFPVSSKLTSLITLCACTGDFILPFVVGKYIESYPSVYLYSLLFYNVLAILVFSLCCALASKLCKIKEILF